MVDLEEKTDSRTHPTIDASASEIRVMQLIMNDRTHIAQSVISKMHGKDRAVFAFYLRELSYMVETADESARSAR